MRNIYQKLSKIVFIYLGHIIDKLIILLMENEKNSDNFSFFIISWEKIVNWVLYGMVSLKFYK